MKSRESTERGVSLVIVAAGLTAFLGFLAIVLDLGMLYAARSDAQKAADAASLAGAKYFLDQGSLPTTLTTPMLNESKAYAKAIGAQNAIRGGNVQPSEVIINDSDIQLVSTNPHVFEVTSRVQRTGLSTYFATLFGVATVDVAATAVARASKSSASSGAPPNYNVGAQCLKPWILQDVSPDGDPFGEEDLGTFVYLHDDQSTNGPSKWGIIAPCPTYTPPPAVPCDGGNSSSVYEQNIVQCNPNTYYCSAGVTINDVPGNKVGKTQDGVRALIHQGGGNQSEGTNNGQDTITWTGTGTADFDYTMTGGSGNPIPALQGQTITQSSSIIIVPLTTDAPPSNGQLLVNITGFLKLFITQIHPPNAKPKSAKNRIDTLVIGVDHCAGAGPGGNGNPNVSSNSGGIDILRLVR
ncbi:MAG: pilus assembly protein TadG-related protein [Acidobacteria bacterium]|nr:pilus assembly protein TadG-related protein [Acidobacteriota bacterium]